MTNAVGNGTVNLTVNVPEAERAIWQRLTDEVGARSANALQRVAWLLGLEQLAEERLALGKTAEAGAILARVAQLRDVRRAHYGLALLVLFAAALVWDSDATLRAARLRGRRQREEVVWCENWEA